MRLLCIRDVYLTTILYSDRAPHCATGQSSKIGFPFRLSFNVNGRIELHRLDHALLNDADPVRKRREASTIPKTLFRFFSSIVPSALQSFQQPVTRREKKRKLSLTESMITSIVNNNLKNPSSVAIKN